MRLRVKDIVNICHGELLFGDENTYIENYSKDTRTLNAGDCYIGIKGDNFDGNMLFEDAFNKGAGVCILENESVNNYEFVNMGRPIILVDNAKEALKDIASYIRDNSKALFIGVTGSVGKTSTRDMIYSVVSKKYKSLKTEGNYNNDIAVSASSLLRQIWLQRSNNQQKDSFHFGFFTKDDAGIYDIDNLDGPKEVFQVRPVKCVSLDGNKKMEMGFMVFCNHLF